MKRFMVAMILAFAGISSLQAMQNQPVKTTVTTGPKGERITKEEFSDGSTTTTVIDPSGNVMKIKGGKNTKVYPGSVNLGDITFGK